MVTGVQAGFRKPSEIHEPICVVFNCATDRCLNRSDKRFLYEWISTIMNHSQGRIPVWGGGALLPAAVRVCTGHEHSITALDCLTLSDMRLLPSRKKQFPEENISREIIQQSNIPTHTAKAESYSIPEQLRNLWEVFPFDCVCIGCEKSITASEYLTLLQIQLFARVKKQFPGGNKNKVIIQQSNTSSNTAKADSYLIPEQLRNLKSYIKVI